MGRGGLVRAAATTAVVAGTATAVSGHMRNKQADKAEEAAEAQAYRDQQAAAAAAPPPPPPAPAPAGGDDLVTKLNELAQLKAQGILSEAEFEAAKAKLLG
jgi:Short C-terminal domain